MSLEEEKLAAFELLVIGALIPIGIYLFIKIGSAIWETVKFEKTYLTLPRVVPKSEFLTCSGRHEWTEVTLALRYLEPGKYTVCSECGAISGNDEYMLSKEGVAVVKESAIIKAKQQKFTEDYKNKVDEISKNKVEQYIISRFTPERKEFKKLLDLYKFIVETRKEASTRAITEMTTKYEEQNYSENSES